MTIMIRVFFSLLVLVALLIAPATPSRLREDLGWDLPEDEKKSRQSLVRDEMVPDSGKTRELQWGVKDDEESYGARAPVGPPRARRE